jgi:tRNA threonylcarbamoyladenosine modification (KEOPS) complex  Pcc1 subunit
MSWLYSIVFAGLMFSSNNEPPVQSCDLAQSDVLVAESALTDETEKFEQSYPISANGRVSVSNVNGSIVVEAWDKNEVRLEATKIADSKEALADVEIKVDSRADSFSVEADYGSWKRDRGEKNWKNRGKLEVQFRLSVPRTAVLDEVETVNGSVTVSNFTNTTKISAVNGNVTASNLRGTANLSTVNGEVTADFDRLETGSRISLETVNGRVNLVIPSDANATLKAESLNGNITNDFGLPVRKGKYVGRDLYGRVGTGEVQIKLESVNGPLSVTRKNDGKSTNPATNLLKQKSKDDDDDEDWDDDDEAASIKSTKINKEIAKAMKDAGKASAEGMKVAQAELARIAPKMDKIRVEGLEKLKDINAAEIQQKVEEGLALQNEALARIRTANWAAGAPYLEKKSNTFGVKGMPKVSIEAKDCGVKVRGWDRPEVKYVLTELAGRRSRTPVSITEDVTDSSVNLKVVNNTRASGRDNFNSDADRVRLEIFVPKRSNLKITTNGEIRLEGVSGDIELNGVDEAINVRDVDGKLYLSSVDGEVRVIGFKGDLDSKTIDGDVYLEGDFSSITGTAVDGRYILTVPENQNADISANVETLTIENMRAPSVVKEGLWRFGSGGPKYTFKVTDGEILIRNANTLMN